MSHSLLSGGVLAKSKEYGRIAADCSNQANSTQDPVKKASLLAMARVWGTLADQQERSEAAKMEGSPELPSQSTDQQVGSNLRARRMALGLSQSAVGDAIGVTFQQIQKYEKGNNRISASKLHRLAEVLQVRPEFFFEGLEQTDPQLSPDFETELHSHADALALIGAFQKISNRKVRRSIIAMLEELVQRDGSDKALSAYLP